MKAEKPQDLDREHWRICSECYRTFEVAVKYEITKDHHFFCCESCKLQFLLWKPDLDAENA